MDKQIIKAVENMLRLNDICVTCVSEIEECDCRKVAEDLCLKLSRKEQECEELNNEAQNLFTEKTNLEIEINQLKAENEELKNFHINLVGVKECEIKELLKLKQTLTEIKEIAEKRIPFLNIDKAKTLTEIEYDYAGKIYHLEQNMHKILQKISEVEDERI